MDFVRRLVGSSPKRQRSAPPPRADISLDRSADDATVLRAVPQFDEPEPPLSDSASRGRPDQLTMLGVTPIEGPPPSGDTATHPNAPPTGAQPGEDAATVYMDVPPIEPPPPRQVATLTAVEGELAGQVFAVLEGENQLGRSPDSDIVLSSRFVSRVHARLVCEDGKINFCPISEQLTLVNGEAASERELGDGDQITLGRTTLELRVES